MLDTEKVLIEMVDELHKAVVASNDAVTHLTDAVDLLIGRVKKLEAR